MGKVAAAVKKLSAELTAFALGLPGAYEDHPWGEVVAKVNKKVFVFFGTEEGNAAGFGMGVKLPDSCGLALELPFVEPAGYGLGKSGWVSVKFPPGDLPPPGLMKEWILESYRAIAPKKLVAELAEGAGSGGPPGPRGRTPPKPARTRKGERGG